MDTEAFLALQAQRRSIYHLGKQVKVSDADLIKAFKTAIKQSPTPFNNQTTRAVFVLGAAHDRLWDMIIDRMRQVVNNDEQFNATTRLKLEGFKNGYGTVLLYTDMAVVKQFEEQFAFYADNFYDWSEEALGIAAYSVWMTATAAHLGGNLQHYNPVIDSDLQAAYDIPDSWRLRGQFVFGSIEEPAGDKDMMDDDVRFITVEP
ncbi:nitroreductase family protein [Weissella halotolerans]|uniref:Oxidoreductase n=1 Tax=Weissella halotolerans DSM 20190 TaxID=1123500 RepID=A0A0R2G0F2_9LACO|nr:nitroreductase family protein [Weissella halotolerans]KRN33243.1 oxidoreductase [Weissella halotolerans DSM 20190]